LIKGLVAIPLDLRGGPEVVKTILFSSLKQRLGKWKN